MDSDDNTKAIVLGNALGREQGESGTYVMGGIITLEEYNPKLINRRGIEQYDIMRLSDPTVHAALTACKLPLQAAIWDIKAASDESLDQLAADFVKRELMERNLNWHQLMSEILTMFDFGFSLFEKTYERTEFEGKTMIGLESLESRKQRSILKWETLDGKPGVYQILQTGGASIDEEKLLLFTNEREGDNYQGRSVLRYAYKPWHMKHNLETITAVGVERMAIGVPVLMPPPRPDSGDVEKAREFLRRFRANSQSYMELPYGWNVEMMDMKANTTKDALPFINYCGVNIMKSVLAQFLELSSTASSTGSRALSEDHSQFFEKACEGKANLLAASVNDNLIQQMCDLNWVNLPNGYPELVFSNLGDEILSEVGTFIQAATGGGVLTPDPDLEDHLRSIARLPGLPDAIRDDYENRQTIATAQTNTALTTLQFPAVDPNGGAQPGVAPTAGTKYKTPAQLVEDPDKKQQSYGKKGEPISRRSDPYLKQTASTTASASSKLADYRNSLIAAVMADESD